MPDVWTSVWEPLEPLGVSRGASLHGPNIVEEAHRKADSDIPGDDFCMMLANVAGEMGKVCPNNATRALMRVIAMLVLFDELPGAASASKHETIDMLEAAMRALPQLYWFPESV